METTFCEARRWNGYRQGGRHWGELLVAFFLAIGQTSGTAQLTEVQSAAVASIARGQPISAWPGLSEDQLRVLENKAETYLVNYRRHHQPYGLTADILFSNRDRARVEKLEGIGDAATWTGHYLAALAFRYSALADDTTLADIRQVLDAFERLTRVTGKDGFLARFAGKADDDAFQRYYSVYGAGPDSNRSGFGTSAFGGVGQYSDWVWLGDPSQDVYIGVNLGLATAFRLVRNEAIQRRIGALVESILDCLIRDNWIIVDPDGRRSRWQLVPVAMASLLRTGATVNPAKYQRLYDEKARVIWSGPVPMLCKYCSYYPNNLTFASYYVLGTLEEDPEKKMKYLETLRQMWQQCSDHLNGYFAALYVSATGDISNLLARSTMEATLADFPEPPRWERRIDQSRRADIEVVTEGGRSWAKHALPVAQRVPSDFIWQRSPCQLGGGSDGYLEYPGIDFLLPYWIARQSGIIVAKTH